MTEQTNNKRSPLGWIIGIVVLLAAATGGGIFWGSNYEAQQIEAGQSAIVAGDWDTAILELNAAAELSPAFLKQNMADTLAMRGFAYYQQGDFESATADLEQALTLDNRFYDVPAYLADIAFKEGEFDRVISQADAAFVNEAQLPQHLLAQLHANKGLALLYSSDGSDGLDNIEAALGQLEYLTDQTVAALYTERALAALQAGDTAAGLADIAQVKQLADSVSSRLLLAEANVHSAQSNQTAAVIAAEEALAAGNLNDSEMADLHLLKAQIAMQNNDLELAIAEADSAAVLDEGLSLPHGLRAWQNYLAFNWDAAIDEADQALEMDEASNLGHRVTGAIALWNGRYADANAAFDMALAADPNDLETIALQTYTSYVTSDGAGIRTGAELAAEIDSNAPASLFAQAIFTYWNYNVDTAYELLTQAIMQDDQRPEYFEMRSATYTYNFQKEAQLEDIETALALNPDFGPAITAKLGYELMQFDDSNEGATIELLVEKFPDWDVPYRFSSEFTFVHLDDQETAFELVEKAIELNPESHRNILARGWLHLESDEPDLALADFEKALEIAPESASTLGALSSYASHVEDFDQAVAYSEQVVDLFNQPSERIGLAADYMFAGNSETAWEIVNELLAVDPKNPSALLLRSNLYLQAQNSTDALNDLTLLINEYPGYSYAYVTRAELRLNFEGKIEEARKDAQKALELNEESSEYAHYILAIVSLVEEDLDQAISHVEDWVAAGDPAGGKYLFLASLYIDQEDEEKVLEAIEAGLALDDEAKEDLMLEKALYLLRAQEDESAKEALSDVIASTTNIDLLNQAELSLDYANSLADLVDGRRLYEGEQFTLTYSPEWIEEPLGPDDFFNLLLFQEGDIGGRVFLVGIIEGVGGFTARNLADAISESLVSNPGFESISLESATVSGRNGLVREYQLVTENEFGETVQLRGRQYYAISGSTAIILSMETLATDYDELSPEWDLIIESFALQ